MAKKYSPEFKERAQRMMANHQRVHDTSGWGSATAVGEKLGVSVGVKVFETDRA